MILSSALALSVLGLPALAQDLDDALAGARNTIGLLEYCQAEGHIDGAAIEVQNKIVAMLPAAGDADKVEAAYAKGKEGILSVNGVEQNIKDADAQGSSQAEVCKQMSDALIAMGAQLPQ
ncbi:pore-forming ESAT-6 family protein [Xinfangfangia sp. D13-10-4-6]|nr:pore-forming ESAT-6 family protein [Pseudogemmobacter hezensis]